MYSTYAFYTGTYHGEMTETEYDKYAPEAAMEIDRLTFGNAANAPDSMKDRLSWAECKMTDLLRSAETIGVTPGNAGVASVSNDGYSVSFQVGANALFRRELENTARKYLTSPVNLMYCGAMVYDNVRHRHHHFF